MDDNASEQDDLDFGVTNKGLAETQRVFDRFRVKGKLGRGGMGEVYLAHDEVLECDVALKFLPGIISTDRVALDELKRETRRGRKLNHPCIVGIFGFEGGRETDRDAAIAMEYIDGDTLSGMRVEKPLRVFSTREIGPWIEQLCEALKYAHTQAKVVHRDLKPANLMVNKDGLLKVTDFGIARSISENVSRISGHRSDSAGTLAYMSPQQADGKRPSPLDDIYSVGALIYELLTGRPPFHRGDIADQVRNKIPPSIVCRRLENIEVLEEDLGTELSKDDLEPIPESWERTVAACLSKNLADRPQSAAEIWEMLSAPAPKTKTAAAEVRNGVPKLVGAVVVALVLCGVGAGWWFGIEAPRREAESKRSAADETARMGETRQEHERQVKARVDGLLDQAQEALAADNLSEARKGFEAVLALDSDNAEATSGLSDVATVEESRQEQERQLKASVDGLLDQAREALAAGKFSEARKGFEAVLTLDADNAEATNGLSAVAKAEEDAKPKTLIVPEQYGSIQAAIDATRAGDTVMVKPGVYKEAITFKDGIRLLGTEVNACRIEPVEGAAAMLTALNCKSGSIENLTFHGNGTSENPVYSVGWTLEEKEGGVYVKEVEEAGPAAKAGVQVGERVVSINGQAIGNDDDLSFYLLAMGGIPHDAFIETEYEGERQTQKIRTVQGKVTGGWPDGVVLLESAVKVSGCVLEGAGGTGILVIGKRSNVTLRRNHSRGNLRFGIKFSNGAGGVIAENECENNKGCGIGVFDSGTAPQLKGNECRGNEKQGIYFGDASGGVAEENECENNKQCGIAVTDSGTAPQLKDNKCHGNEMHGIFFFNGSGGVAEGNECTSNRGDGIRVNKAGTSPKLIRNRCNNNAWWGICVEEQSILAAFEGNTATGNREGQIIRTAKWK